MPFLFMIRLTRRRDNVTPSCLYVFNRELRF